VSLLRGGRASGARLFLLAKLTEYKLLCADKQFYAALAVMMQRSRLSRRLSAVSCWRFRQSSPRSAQPLKDQQGDFVRRKRTKPDETCVAFRPVRHHRLGPGRCTSATAATDPWARVTPAFEGLKRSRRIAARRAPDELNNLLKLAGFELGDALDRGRRQSPDQAAGNTMPTTSSA
jgi:hypothetical protein